MSDDRPDADSTGARTLVRLETHVADLKEEVAEQRGSRRFITWIVGIVAPFTLAALAATAYAVFRVDSLERRAAETQKSLDAVNDVRADLRVLTTDMRHEAEQSRQVNSATVVRLETIERRLEQIGRRR